MKKIKTKTKNEIVKESRHNVGYYHDDYNSIHALAWHNCSDKLMFVPVHDFKITGKDISKWVLVQAKGPINKALKDEEKDFLLKWVNSKGLDLKTKDLSA